VVLWIMGVPYRGVVAVFVGFADLIPLVGATLGAVVAIAVAALHSLPAAIVVLVVFVVYQQLENHVLQPVIMSRTVELSALTVLVSILIGVELFGFLGALLAIPVAGVLHVIGRDLYDSYRGRLKPNRPPAPTRSQCPRHSSNPASSNPATPPPPAGAEDPEATAAMPARRLTSMDAAPRLGVGADVGAARPVTGSDGTPIHPPGGLVV
jgi:hypothetical protein